jgi:hypothetical protein
MATWHYHKIDVRKVLALDCDECDHQPVDGICNPYEEMNFPRLLAVSDEVEADKFSNVQGADGDNDIVLYAHVATDAEPDLGTTVNGCQSWTISGTPIDFTSSNFPLAIILTSQAPELAPALSAMTVRVSDVNGEVGWEIPSTLVPEDGLHASCSCDTYWGCESDKSAPVDNTTNPQGANYMMGATAELYGTAPTYAADLEDDDHGCASYWACVDVGGECESALSISSSNALNEPDTRTQNECEELCIPPTKLPVVGGDPHVRTFFGEKYDM